MAKYHMSLNRLWKLRFESKLENSAGDFNGFFFSRIVDTSVKCVWWSGIFSAERVRPFNLLVQKKVWVLFEEQVCLYECSHTQTYAMVHAHILNLCLRYREFRGREMISSGKVSMCSINGILRHSTIYKARTNSHTLSHTDPTTWPAECSDCSVFSVHFFTSLKCA